MVQPKCLDLTAPDASDTVPNKMLDRRRSPQQKIRRRAQEHDKGFLLQIPWIARDPTRLDSTIARFKDYQLSWIEAVAISRRDKGCCSVCGLSFDARGFVIDHDHTSGQIRGFVHQKCNHHIGMLEMVLKFPHYLVPALNHIKQNPDTAKELQTFAKQLLRFAFDKPPDFTELLNTTTREFIRHMETFQLKRFNRIPNAYKEENYDIYSRLHSLHRSKP